MRRIITFFIILTFTSIHSFAQADPCNPTILEFPDGTCAYTTTTIYTEFSNATVSYSGIPYPSDCPVSGGVFGCGDLFEPGTDNDDIWFEVTVPVGATELNIFMNWYDPPLFNVANPGYAIYSGNTTNCNSPNYLTGTCDGDCGAFPTTSFSETLTGVTPGDTYLVRVWEVDDQDMNFDITVTTQDSSPTNDDCIDAEDLTGFGCNYGATDNNEPDSWAPVPSGFSCSGGNWSSNENGVWYTFEVTPTTDQPISIQVNGVVCNGQNGGNLQMGIWSNTGTCDLSTETFYECAVGNGTLGINNLNLPVGDYYVFVDGDGGDECTWTFTSNEILPPDTQCPSYLAPVANATACGNQPYNVEIPLDNCPGVVQMALQIITDGYGEELYWYVVNNTSGATILTGGTQGGGSAYADNSIFNVGIGPLDPNVDGTSYTLFIEDSFGDGGCQIIVTDVGNGNVLYDSGTTYTTGTNGSMIPQIFGASSVTVNWTLPDGSIVTENLGMCGTPNRNFTLTTANTCQTETQTIGYEVVCNNDATVLSTGSINVDVAPAIPTDPNNLVSITINPSTCLAEYTYQNDCTSAEMTITEVIAPIAGSSGNAEYTVTYTGPGATDCCSTGGPLQAFSQSSTDLGGSTSAIVGGPVNSPFGGTNNSELLTWAAPGTGGLVSSASFTINVNNYNSNFPITTDPFYWVTVEVDGIIVYDAASDPGTSTPPFSGSVTITEADNFKCRSFPL